MNWDGLNIKSRLSSLALSSHDAIPGADANSVEKVTRAGERLVCHLQSRVRYVCTLKSHSLGVERKVGGKLHLKLKKCLSETNSEQVLWRKDAKDFENKVNKCLKLLEGKWVGKWVGRFAWWDWRMALAFMSVSALLLTLSVKTSSILN